MKTIKLTHGKEAISNADLIKQIISERDKNLDEIIHFEREYNDMINNNRFYAAAEIGTYINSLQRKNKNLNYQMNLLVNNQKQQYKKTA